MLYNVLMYFSCCLSILGALFMTIVILSFKELREFNFRMIFYLTLTDILVPIAYLFTPKINESHTICVIQAYLINFGNLSSLLWTACIMFALYRLIILERPNSHKLEIYFCLFSWGIPFIFSTAFLQNFDMSGEWCWIKENDTYLMLSLFYIPLAIVIAFNITLCLKVWNHIKRNKDSVVENHNIKVKVFTRLMSYPVILIICFTPATVHRFYKFFRLQDQESLYITAMFGNCIYGFCNSIVFGSTKHIRKRIKEKIFPKYICRDSLMIEKESSTI